MDWIRAARNLLSNIYQILVGPKTIEVPRVDDQDLKTYASYFWEQAQSLIGDLVDGDISVIEWYNSMKVELERLHTTAYIIYRGGIDTLSQEDMKALSDMVSEQTAYLKSWAEEMELSGEIPSKEYLEARMKQYMGAVNETVQRASTIAVGLPVLPAYPADGKTPCLSHCLCSWRIDPVEGGYDLYWDLADAEHCEGCKDRAARYNPLRIRGGVILPS